MLCLGIESTAHTFAASVIELSSIKNNDNKTKIPKNRRVKILSDIRSIYKPPEGFGIHPRLASRHHIEVCVDILKESLRKAGTSVKDIDLIAYSAGPGLGPCLRVGAVISRTLATFHKKPLVPVNHALGHIEIGAMLTGARDPLVLLVSGGHTMILAFSQNRWRVFGETLDITVGQLLDQFGRSIGFASPCGNKIEEVADQASGLYVRLPYVVKGNDVSFSGMLTAAKKLVHGINKNKESYRELCYSLQETAFAMITEVMERAMSVTCSKEVMVVGGVAANKRLAQMLYIASKRQGSQLFVCPVSFSGDNGVQIAWTGILQYISTSKRIDIKDSFVCQSWRIDSVDVNWRTK
jgi:N6-L-threonylcarbamoyladenine synthase